MAFPDPWHGRQVGPYTLRARLGGGGSGAVYAAWDTRLEREVALKLVVFPPGADESALARFQREAKLAARLAHPNIVPVYDVGQVDDPFPAAYLAMRRLPGPTLDDLSAEEGQLPEAKAIALAITIASALDYAHRQGVIHRDLKPANILIDEEGHPLLADFGIAKALEERPNAALTLTGTTAGTPPYMSPEQAAGDNVDQRSDLYSLGVLLYELLTGRPPFRGSAALVMRAHIEQPPPDPREFRPTLSPALSDLVVRALAKDPAHRFASGAEFAAALKTLGTPRHTETPHERSTPSTSHIPAPAPRPRGLTLMLALLVGASVVGLGVVALLANSAWRGTIVRATQTAETFAALTEVRSATATVSATLTLALTATITPTISPTVASTATSEPSVTLTPAPVSPTIAPLPATATPRPLPPTPPPAATPTATATASPTISATPELSPTITATATPTPLLAVLCEIPIAPEFETLWQSDAGCPTGTAFGQTGALQIFQFGLMFWRADRDAVHVLFEPSLQWAVYTDPWTDGDPSFSCLEAETAGMPVRGFGKVWCTHDDVRQRLGPALNAEHAVSFLLQPTASGALMLNLSDEPVRYLLYPTGRYHAARGEIVP